MLRHRAFIIAFAAAPLLAQDPGADAVSAPGVRKLTFGGQYRLRYEGFFDYDRDSDTGNTTDFFGQRVRFDAKFELSDDLSGFVQLQDARVWGEEAWASVGAVGTDDSADGFDLHQGYIDIAKTPGLGGSTRLGRFEVSLGDQRLVGALDWATGARALDGVLHTWALKDAALHAFYFHANEAPAGANPSTTDQSDDALFGGFYYARKFADGVDGEVYLMHLHADINSLLGGTGAGGNINVSTIGTRWDIKATDDLSFNVEVASQTGELAGADIPFGDTYAAHLGGTWAFGGDLNPRLTVAIDAASGNDPSTPDNERFTGLFPTGHKHWGMMDLASWSNLMNPWIRLQLAPCGMSDVSLTFLNFSAMESSDTFGGPRGTLSAGGT
ncbi:MAG: alginate export family protein, partial [Planctomycetes bacterium]|nr:alginate export family protein [Planctomycetota bacterium]